MKDPGQHKLWEGSFLSNSGRSAAALLHSAQCKPSRVALRIIASSSANSDTYLDPALSVSCCSATRHTELTRHLVLR